MQLWRCWLSTLFALLHLAVFLPSWLLFFFSSLNFDFTFQQWEKEKTRLFFAFIFILFLLIFFVSVRVLHSNESETATANSRSPMMNYFATLFGQRSPQRIPTVERVNKIKREKNWIFSSFDIEFNISGWDWIAWRLSLKHSTNAGHHSHQANKYKFKQPLSLSLSLVSAGIIERKHNRCRQVSLVRLYIAASSEGQSRRRLSL